MDPWVIVLVVVSALAVSAGVSYNRFARQRSMVANSWANVDTELQRRHDLIPNLVETVRGYAAHERDTLERVVRARVNARSAADTSARETTEGEVTAGLRQLLAVAEDYPTLMADRSFVLLQRELVTTENRIQASRRLYNGNVREINRRVESVPSNLVALVFGFGREPYFEIEAAATDLPTVELR